MPNFLKRLHQHLFLPITRLGGWQSLIVALSIIVVLASLPGLVQSATDYFVPLEELSRKATLARQEGNTKTAIRLYQIISDRAAKSDYSSNYELGNLYMQNGRWRVAEKYYLKAAANPAALSGVFYQLSNLYANHLPQSRDKFAQLLIYRLNTDRKTDSGLMIVLASFYRDWGKIDPAINWYRQASILEPNNQAVIDAIKSLEETAL